MSYTPPDVWTWTPGNGGQFANINRPVAGATHDKDLPVGKHPFQLYSLLLMFLTLCATLAAMGRRSTEDVR